MSYILESILPFWRSLYFAFPTDVQGWALFALRIAFGVLFIFHGYPKLTHLRRWSEAMKIPIWLCFLSAISMFLGGFCLIAGFLTPFVCLFLICSMVFALYLQINMGLPLVPTEPYLIPQSQYLGANGKGEPPSLEKAFIYNVILVVLLAFGPGAYSLDAWLLK